MIDLHSHILFGIDDGASDLGVSLEMARQAVDDGVEVMACTPHFLPGLFDPSPADVTRRVEVLNDALADSAIDLAVVSGCEAHVRPDMVGRLRSGKLLAIHRGRYVLCEMPEAVRPPNLDHLFFNMLTAGYIPLIAHVERYAWATRDVPWISRMAESGILMQVTAGSLLGNYGRGPQSLAITLLQKNLVHIVASDAHDTRRRPPGLAKARDFVAREVGREVARRLFATTPESILMNGMNSRGRIDMEAAQSA